MAIRDMGFGRRRPFIERGYREGGKYQWVRETAMNAIEAQASRVEFSIEWQGVRNRRVYRRMIADDGIGMTADEMESYLNKFGDGGKDIGDAHDNYGIGAKTALLPWNPYGVVVISYVDGNAAMVWLQYDSEKGEYGLKLFDAIDEDGHESLEASVVPFNDEEHGVDWASVRPDWLTDHGTVFVLMGKAPDDDTILGDHQRGEAGIKDISRYLNHRLWELPNVRISVEEFGSTEKTGWPTTRSRAGGFHSQFREVRGAQYYITNPVSRKKEDDREAKIKTGKVMLRDGQTTIEWYLRRGDKSKIWSYAPSSGFIAVKYKNELHNITDHQSTYRNFGVVESEVRSNLWLIVTPPMADGKTGVYHKSDRNELAWVGGESLPINDWGVEFAENMPAEVLRAIREARGSVTCNAANDAWSNRMAARFAERFKIMKKRRDSDGIESAGDVAPRLRIVPVAPMTPPQPPSSPPTPVRKRAPKRPVLNPFGEQTRSRTGKAKGSIPDYRITQNPEDIEPGMIAAYTPPNAAEPNGLVTIFGDHPVLKEVITYWQDRFPAHHASEIRKEIEKVYGTVAAFKVAHSEHLSGLVDRKVIEEMRSSPRALTIGLLGIAAEEAMIEKRMKRFGRSKKGLAAAA